MNYARASNYAGGARRGDLVLIPHIFNLHFSMQVTSAWLMAEVQ